MSSNDTWPELPPFADWEATHTTLQMWCQIVGKIRMGLTPLINHWWEVPLYPSTRGLTTSPIPYRDGAFAIDFDFISHMLRITTTEGGQTSLPLKPMAVADFYQELISALEFFGIAVSIYPKPVEVLEAIPFPEDRKHAQYDPEVVHQYWQALIRVSAVLTEFRARFIGKVSPVHFFWGAMDLAVTRFSGRTAPKHPGGAPNCPNRVMEEAYSHEVSSAGFWAGSGLGEAAFYSYAYPYPAGFNERPVLPGAAYYHDTFGEFILPYAAIRAENPRENLLTFLQSTYEAAADLAQWDRTALER